MEATKTVFEIEGTQHKEERQVDTSLRHEHGVADSWIAPLCVSHAAAAWGERSWEFGAGLLLLQLNGTEEKLRLTAILVLAEGAVCSVLGSRIGRAVDRASFLYSAVLMLAAQSVGITAAAGFLLWAFDRNDNLWLAVGAIACSVLARLGSLGSTIAVEKRWATALAHHTQFCYDRLDSKEQRSDETIDESHGEHVNSNIDEDNVSESRPEEADGIHVHDDSPVLSKVNARLRCIDLMCNLWAPIVVGFLLESTSAARAALSIAAFNAMAWPIEVTCLV